MELLNSLLFLNFSLFSVPTSELIQEEWLPYLDPQHGNCRYLNIEASALGMMNEPMPFNQRMEFLNDIFETPKEIVQ